MEVWKLMSCSQSRGSSAATSLGGLMLLGVIQLLRLALGSQCKFSLYFSKPWLYSVLSGLSRTKNCIDGIKVSSEKKKKPTKPALEI